MQFGVVDALDMATNIVCLYLQYTFANKAFRTYCTKVDVCCHRMMTRNMKARVKSVSPDVPSPPSQDEANDVMPLQMKLGVRTDSHYQE